MSGLLRQSVFLFSTRSLKKYGSGAYGSPDGNTAANLCPLFIFPGGP